MRSLLGHRDFRLLFLGQGLSTIGDRIVFVALALYVTDIGTPSDVGVVLACHAVPLVGFLLIGGVWADRLPRHLVVVTTDLIRFGLHALLAVLIFSGAVEIWHIAVIEAAFGTAEAFYRPAYTGLVPQTVPEDEIQPAKAAFGTLETVAEFLGPALATVLVLGVGPGLAFAIDAATFLVSAALLVRLRPRPRGEAVVRTTVLRELREGWIEVRSRAWVWAIIGGASLGLLVGYGPWMTLGPTVSIEHYDTRAVYGILVSAMGAGTVVGALIGFRWRPRHPMRAGVLLCLPWTVASGLFALGLPLGVLVVLFVAAGTGIALFGIWWETALAERIPPHTLSRVTAYDWMGSLALLPIGYVLAGPLGEALGAVEVVAVGSALSLGALAASLLVRDVWRLERITEAGASP
ncbi:MAG: MFS transporter [Solirubrobacteraceae bacterium]